MQKLPGMLLILLSFALMPAHASPKQGGDEKIATTGDRVSNQQEQDFENAYKSLKDLYKDDVVSAAFDKYKDNIGAFPKSREIGMAEHSPRWHTAYRAAFAHARAGEWEQARVDLAAAKAPVQWVNKVGPYGSGEPVMADVLLLSAIVNRASAHYGEAVNDLNALFVLHQQHSHPWNYGSELFSENQ